MKRLIKLVQSVKEEKKPKYQIREIISQTLTSLASRNAYGEHKEALKTAGFYIGKKSYHRKTIDKLPSIVDEITFVLTQVHDNDLTSLRLKSMYDGVEPDRDDDMLIYQHMQKAKQIDLNSTIGIPTIYVFATSVDLFTMVLKIGYTAKGVNVRQKELIKEHDDADFYLLMIKSVTSESDEKELHKDLSQLFQPYPYMNLKGKRKVELYKFDNQLIEYMEAFEGIVTSDITSLITLKKCEYKCKKQDTKHALVNLDIEKEKTTQEKEKTTQEKEKTTQEKEKTTQEKEKTNQLVQEGENLKQEERNLLLQIELEKLRQMKQ